MQFCIPREGRKVRSMDFCTLFEKSRQTKMLHHISQTVCRKKHEHDSRFNRGWKNKKIHRDSKQSKTTSFHYFAEYVHDKFNYWGTYWICLPESIIKPKLTVTKVICRFIVQVWIAHFLWRSRFVRARWIVHKSVRASLPRSQGKTPQAYEKRIQF